METNKPFANYAEMEKHGLKLRLRSETAALRFGKHIHAFSDKEVRSTLMKGALNDALDEMKPMRTAVELMTSGGVVSQVLMGLVTRKGGFMRRLVTSVAVVVLPNLLEKVPWTNVVGKVSGALHEVPHKNGVH